MIGLARDTIERMIVKDIYIRNDDTLEALVNHIAKNVAFAFEANNKAIKCALRGECFDRDPGVA